jgi:hypothetical protein
MRRRRQPHIDAFDIDRGIDPPSAYRMQSNPQQIGTSYLWIGSTGKLIEILKPGDPGYEENERIVAAALRPLNGGTSR